MNARSNLSEADVMGQGVAQLRVPPHATEAESSVLGGLLLDNSAWDRVGDLLTDSDFYRHEHKLIYAAIGALINASKPADVITVYGYLENAGNAAEVGGLIYLNTLAQYVPSAANIRRYAETVRERSILRQLITASDETATAAFNPQGRTVDQILDDAEQKVCGIKEGGNRAKDDWESMDTLMVRQLDNIQNWDEKQAEAGAHYVPTGLDDLDELLDGGMRGGELIVLAARPRMGKSALAKTIEMYVASGLNLPVGEFSMEMENDAGAQRALSAAARIPMHKLRRPDRMNDLDWGSLTPGVDKLRGIPFYAYDKAGLNINQVRSKARQLRSRRGLRLLVVDYFQLMSGMDPRMNRTYQLEEASRGLKTLAKELGIPILLLAQVLRGVEKETDQMPKLSDLKDCGSLEQDADSVWFMHREFAVKPDLSDEWAPYCRLRVAKNRGGRTGEIPLFWEGQYTRYSTWPQSLDIPTDKVIVPRTNAARKPL